MWQLCGYTSQSWTLIPRVPTLCLYGSSNSAGGTLYQASERLRWNDRAVARAVSVVGRWVLERSRRSNSSHRFSMGFRSGLGTGQSISGTLLSTNHSLTHLDIWHGVLSRWYRVLSSPNWSSTLDSMQRVKMSLYPSVVRFPRSITREPSPFHEKHPHTVMSPPNFTVGTSHAGRYRSLGIHHTQTLPSDCHMAYRDSSPQITRFQLSTVQWHRSLRHFRRRLAFTGEIFGLWAAARPWNPVPLNSRRTVMLLAGQFVALRNSRIIVSLDVRRVSRTTFFKVRLYLSVTKRDYPVMFSLWLCHNVSTSQSHHQPLTWATWEGFQCPWQISYWSGKQ
jgi:hypothetical protein